MTEGTSADKLISSADLDGLDRTQCCTICAHSATICDFPDRSAAQAQMNVVLYLLHWPKAAPLTSNIKDASANVVGHLVCEHLGRGHLVHAYFERR